MKRQFFIRSWHIQIITSVHKSHVDTLKAAEMMSSELPTFKSNKRALKNNVL